MAAASTEIPEALAATASVAAGVTDNTTPLAATASVAAGAAVVAVAAAAEAAVASVVDHGSVQAQACAAIQAAQAASGKSQAHQVANQPWDAHLEDPSSQKGYSFIPEMTPEERRVSLNVCGPRATDFMNRCEFIGLGCYCAPSYALQLMGLRKNSYPFDWTRSSLEGVLHCIDVKFEDFMTYSTYQMVDQHVVFGGTRWGGSFWHHNLEAPLTLEDMTRRVRRFLGLGDVPTKVPRVFVRIINSTRELRQLQRLRQTLKEAFPDAQEIYLLILVELQNERGPIVVNAPEGEGVVVFSFTEEEFRQVPAPGRHPLALSGGRCCEAIAAAVKFWSRDGADGLELKTYDSFAQLSSKIYQFDGGDPARELFVPRRFWGQQLNLFGTDSLALANLLSTMQQQAFMLPAGVDASKPFPVQCFGRYLQVILPPFAQPGLVVQLFLNNGQLSAMLSSLYEGRLVNLTEVVVEDQSEPTKMDVS
ncbi:cyb5r2 [Symbiodinium sp. KB8]|nr:cyb5r2 [Symbiodinium sp. KB8]